MIMNNFIDLKRVAWPPPPEDQDIEEYIEQGPVQAKVSNKL